MPAQLRKSSWSIAVALLLVMAALPAGAQSAARSEPLDIRVATKPAPAPVEWKALIGEYEDHASTVNIMERDGHLYFSPRANSMLPMQQVTPGAFKVGNDLVKIESGPTGEQRFTFSGKTYKKRHLGDLTHSFRITPVRRPEELRREALASTPPVQSGTFSKPDLVELTTLDPTIKLDIRYATTNNFMGVPFYTEARAFMQQPAAEALVRANRVLHSYGYGLLIHDAYRPWFVTRMFWDATPDDKKVFVADPAQGSNHNRGGAVDLTLYDLKTGQPVEMPGTYDEMSDRSYPDYPGGTSLQRWHRDLLRAGMESQGFTVYKYEWWHFDYKDWPKYPILNTSFSELSRVRKTESKSHDTSPR